MTYTNLPGQGVVFWPVGTGDSTTVVVADRHVLQVDLHDMDAADDDDAVVAAVIDRLAETLPTTDDDDPYLAVFALTHADADHCGGFGDLLDSDILIGELWATPRLWREFAGDEQEMCEDAHRFQKEAERRVAATLKAVKAGRQPTSGDRIRIIGYDVDREDHSYAELPDEYFTYPGQAITTMDGDDVSSVFEAFVHAPFKDDCAAARNDTSLAMQVTLRHPDDGTEGHILLLGDLAYETIKKIFDFSAPKRPERLAWDVTLAAHHCSKKVMYAPGDNGEEELKQDILDTLTEHATDGAYVVASSRPFRDADKPGDNPPHLLARDHYDEVAPEGVLCTGEYSDVDAPRPIVFGLCPGEGLVLLPVEELEEPDRAVEAAGSRASRLLKALGTTAAVAGGLGAAVLAARAASRRRLAAPAGSPGVAGVRDAIRRARGEDAAPATSVGFGVW